MTIVKILWKCKTTGLLWIVGGTSIFAMCLLSLVIFIFCAWFYLLHSNPELHLDYELHSDSDLWNTLKKSTQFNLLLIFFFTFMWIPSIQLNQINLGICLNSWWLWWRTIIMHTLHVSRLVSHLNTQNV